MSDAVTDHTCKTPTRVRTAAEEDAWRARQTLASCKQTRQTPATSSASHAYHHRRAAAEPSGQTPSALGGADAEPRGRATGSAPLLPLTKGPSPQTKWTSSLAFSEGGAASATRGEPTNGAAANLPGTDPRRTSPPSSASESVGFPINIGGFGGRGGGAVEGNGTNALPRWEPSAGLRGESDDEVQMEEEEEEEDEDGLGGNESRADLEAFSAALREEFERKILVTAREGLKAASQKATAAGQLRLEAQRREDARTVRCLEEERGRLRGEVAGLERSNAALARKADAFGHRLAALQARTSKSSVVARCLSVWRANATRAITERLKNKIAMDHARLKLTTRFLSAWRIETRRCINTRGRKAADLKLHVISKEIIERYEAELSTTRAALDEANCQIALEKARQREMEAGMRRTLMRGMSAMNMEAMQLMTEARDAGEELFGLSGTSGGSRYSGALAASSLPPHPVATRQRISEECPRPLAPPRPSVPSSRAGHADREFHMNS